jgi:hypothetical protein
VLYVAARSGKTWRRDRHNQIDIGAVVVLKNGGDVDHFGLRIRPYNFQVLSFFETTSFESVDEPIHALVITDTLRVVHDGGFEFPSTRRASIGRRGRSSMC